MTEFEKGEDTVSRTEGYERARKAVDKLHEAISEMSVHPGISIVNGPRVLAGESTETLAKFEKLPIGMMAFYSICGGIELVWESAGPDLLPSDQKDTGRISLLPLSQDQSTLTIFALAKENRIHILDICSHCTCIGLRLEKDEIVYLDEHHQVHPLPLTFLDYVELLGFTRGFTQWQTILLPGALTSYRSSHILTVIRYLFPDFRQDIIFSHAKDDYIRSQGTS